MGSAKAISADPDASANGCATAPWCCNFSCRVPQHWNSDWYYGNGEEDSDEDTLPELSLSTDFAIKRLGEAINISCVSYGSESVAPRDISWELNGRVVSNLEKVYKPEMIEAKLVFRRVRLEDEGNYKCYLVQDKSSFKITNLVVNHFDGSFNCV